MILATRWLLPISRPPVRDGWIEIEGGSIRRVGSGVPPPGATVLGDVAVLPGLVNAHTHLELSWMAGLVPPAPSMSTWIRGMMRTRRAGAPGGDAGARLAAQQAALSASATGTVLMGDVSNTLMTPPVLQGARLGGVVFHELLGFSLPDPVGLVAEAHGRAREAARLTKQAELPIVVTVAAHAPYSVSPALFREIATRHEMGPLALHLGESPEELEFLRTGRGPLREILKTLGVWTEAWAAPECDPVEYVHRMGYLQPGMLAVHGVHLSDRALGRLAAAGAVLVTCPRSNLWVGAGMPRLAHFYAADLPVAIGTDSLASVTSLNMFDELAEMRRMAPDVTAASFLESATRVGAEALGLGRSFGTLEPGKRAELVVVDVPPGVSDVEEYLVSGVPASAVRRLF